MNLEQVEWGFQIAYKSFLDFLVKNYGIKYKVIPRTPFMAIPSFDFDVSAKLSEKLRTNKLSIIEKAERLKR
ncbi:hypothetical protein A3D77_00270 [Candidatus Gottesmanbacteria bacterium RIFCSPHIGHO2_02_FULL_39_11]|uniref:Uncharacterized protein n=1 Tax=Candidatus Gottesmanbacteria bacterium RIFCSPHIGHO2_02_FULL_39_11 TaxID=1798382 RepID=A0A1F5ZWJ1_9BACT|nr:MAG: hypothetical protein A3D77_00270 [Candidatus Gottesmanbacteria bacterium RIFCSPHIGHO2_02_FULL_39_11]